MFTNAAFSLNYNTLSNEEIMDVDVGCLSKGGFIFLWVINSQMQAALDCLSHWGYLYIDRVCVFYFYFNLFYFVIILYLLLIVFILFILFILLILFIDYLFYKFIFFIFVHFYILLFHLISFIIYK